MDNRDARIPLGWLSAVRRTGRSRVRILVGVREKIVPLLRARRVNFVEGPTATELGAAVGREQTAAVGVIDAQLARGIRALVINTGNANAGTGDSGLRDARALLRLVRDESLAEDLISEVFLDVWRQADRFERRSSVATWLLAIGRYKALSALRKKPQHAADDEQTAAIPDPVDTPEQAMQKTDKAMKIVGACFEALLQYVPVQVELKTLSVFVFGAVTE